MLDQNTIGRQLTEKVQAELQMLDKWETTFVARCATLPPALRQQIETPLLTLVTLQRAVILDDHSFISHGFMTWFHDDSSTELKQLVDALSDTKEPELQRVRHLVSLLLDLTHSWEWWVDKNYSWMEEGLNCDMNDDEVAQFEERLSHFHPVRAMFENVVVADLTEEGWPSAIHLAWRALAEVWDYMIRTRHLLPALDARVSVLAAAHARDKQH